LLLEALGSPERNSWHCSFQLSFWCMLPILYSLKPSSVAIAILAPSPGSLNRLTLM